METPHGPPDDLERAVGELTHFLLGPGSLDTAMNRIAGLAVAAIPACDTCSVSLVEGHRVVTQVATDQLAERLDTYQYDNDSGPCLEAIRTDAFYKIVSMAEETRWPEFTARAAEEGLQSSYSVPLRVDGHTVGALNLYS